MSTRADREVIEIDDACIGAAGVDHDVRVGELDGAQVDLPARLRAIRRRRREELCDLELAVGVALDRDLDVVGDQLVDPRMFPDQREQADPDPQRMDRDRRRAVRPVDHDVVQDERAERTAVESADVCTADEQRLELCLEPGAHELATAIGVNEDDHGGDREHDRRHQDQRDPSEPPAHAMTGHQNASPRLM